MLGERSSKAIFNGMLPMKLIRTLLVLFCATVCVTAAASDSSDREAMQKTMAGVTDAFSKGDLTAIASYHHPNVEKALSYTKHLVGREAVIEDLRGTLNAYRLEFVKHDVESLTFLGDTCVEMTRFTIRGEPKGNAQPFTFSGRAMVVYVRYSGSPTGWASIREVVQPATE